MVYQVIRTLGIFCVRVLKMKKIKELGKEF